MVCSVSACDGCRGHKPYTPYTLDTSTPTSTSAPPLLPSSGRPDPAYTPIRAEPAPGEGRTWTLGGRPLEAPGHQRFRLGLPLDPDADGTPRTLLWAESLRPATARMSADTSPTAKPLVEGQLLLARGTTLEPLASLPPELGALGCPLDVQLERIRPATGTLRLAARCLEDPGPRARWGLVLDLGAARTSVRQEVQLGPRPGRELPELTFQAQDLDGDGREDLELELEARPPLSLGEPGRGVPSPLEPPPLRARLRFLDRPAGLARDPSEPEASLQALASSLTKEALRKNPRDLSGEAEALRLLVSSLCGPGRPLLRLGASAASCSAAALLDQSLYLEGMNAFGRGDVARGLAALGALAHSGSEGKKVKELEKALEKGTLAEEASVRMRVAAQPELQNLAGSSPLRFESAGSLLVDTPRGVVRVDVEQGTETEDASLPRWSRAPHLEGSVQRLLRGVVQRCEGGPPALRLELGEGAQEERPLPFILGGLGGALDALGHATASCARLESLPLSTMDLGPGRYVGAVGSQAFALETQGPELRLGRTVVSRSGASSPGSARSPDGKALVLSTERGLLVLRDAKDDKPLRLLHEDASKAQACTVADGGLRVACVVDGSAQVFDSPRQPRPLPPVEPLPGALPSIALPPQPPEPPRPLKQDAPGAPSSEGAP